jgi:hypothetical protein
VLGTSARAENPARKLVFATMFCTADRWCRVSSSDLERPQLKLLCVELRLDPPQQRLRPSLLGQLEHRD